MLMLQHGIWSTAGDSRWAILPLCLAGGDPAALPGGGRSCRSAWRGAILPLCLAGGALIGWTRLMAAGPDLETQIARARDPTSVHRRETLWVALGAVFAVGFGGAIGPEAGIIAVTAQLSSIVALRLRRSASERRLLARAKAEAEAEAEAEAKAEAKAKAEAEAEAEAEAKAEAEAEAEAEAKAEAEAEAEAKAEAKAEAEAGMAGALSGVHASPAGGPVHAESEARLPKPLVLAAGVAGFAAVMVVAETVLPGALEMMRMPRLTADAGPWDSIVALGAGLAGALAGAGYLLARHASARALSFGAQGRFWQPLAGGAALGLLCTAAPILRFSGHEEMGEMIRLGTEHGAGLLVLLALGKALACALCTGAHWQGGVVCPMCFAGGAAGAATLALFPGLDPVTGVAPGMAAASAVGVTRPLVAGLIMLFVLGGGLAVPVFVGALAGRAVLAALPPALIARARGGHCRAVALSRRASDWFPCRAGPCP